MADNRMYLANHNLKLLVRIGTFNPGFGWECNSKNLSDDLNKAFEKEPEGLENGDENRWYVIYETDTDESPWPDYELIYF